MGLVGKRYSENLKDFIDAAFQFHIVLYYCHKTVSDHGTIYLDAHGILRGATELLDAALVLPEFYPLEHRQAKVGGGGVEGIDMTVKLEDFLYSPPAGFLNHGECELLEDAVITLLVGC